MTTTLTAAASSRCPQTAQLPRDHAVPSDCAEQNPAGSSRPPETPDADNASRFQAVADLAPMMAWMSGPDRRCDWFNRRWLEFTGRSMAEEIGSGWIASVHPEDADRCLSIYTVSFDARAPFEMDFRLRRHDGAYRWVLDQGAPHHSPEGHFLGYVGCCIDIDERRSLEDRLALRTEALRLSERRRDVFLTGLVDELSASLASARQAALAMTEKTPARDVMAAAMALVETLQVQLTRLLGEARRSARSVSVGRADRPARTVTALLQEAFSAIPSQLLRAESRLRLTAPGTDRSIVTAPPLGRIIGGLFETALRCSGHASTIDGEVILDERGGALSIRIAADPGGLSPAFLPLALEYFPDPLAPGSGLANPRDAAPASGVAVFAEPGSRAVTFVMSPPWIERPAG